LVYIFDAKYDRYQATKIHSLIKAGALAKDSASRIIDQLKVKGISYRRKEMLHDVRRARAVELCKTTETRLNSGYFFDFVYEPFRDTRGLVSHQANRVFEMWDKDTFETPEEVDMIVDIAQRYAGIQDLL